MCYVHGLVYIKKNIKTVAIFVLYVSYISRISSGKTDLERVGVLVAIG